MSQGKTVTVNRAGSDDQTDVTVEPGDTAADVIKAFAGSPDQYELKTKEGGRLAPDDDLFQQVDQGDELVTAAIPKVG